MAHRDKKYDAINLTGDCYSSPVLFNSYSHKKLINYKI